METKILTELQDRVLNALFEAGFGEKGYFLTGGTALAAYYLHHRFSDDLDFFTRSSRELPKASLNFIFNILDELGLIIEDRRVAPEHVLLFVSDAASKGPGLKLDFVQDVPNQMAEAITRDKVVIDSLEDIAVNKVCAILSRQPPEPKDFFDLFFILQETRFSLDYLLARAREKEAAFDHEDGLLAFAARLLNPPSVRKLRAIKIVDDNTLHKFLVPKAEEIIRRLRPKS